MKKGILLFSLFIIILTLFSCSPKVVPPTQELLATEDTKGATAPLVPTWQALWNETLQAGRKERTVSVYNTAGASIRAAIMPAFKEKTGIELELTTASGAQAVAKIVSERRNGLYLVDVFTGGTSTIFSSLKPAGALDPIGPALILPEVLDKSAWLGGDLNYIDEARQFVLAFTGNPGSSSLTLNRNMIKKDEITSYYDILDTKWKGKVIMLDPTQAGKGGNWFHKMLVTKALDMDYMRALAKQEPIPTRNERMLIEWVVQGKRPIGMFISKELVGEFQKAGANIEEGRLLKEDFPDIGAARGGSVVLINRAPHPNAARVFINWLLSREGQYTYSKAGIVQSRRLDVPTDYLPADSIRDPKINYFNTQTEAFRTEEPKYLEIAREVFGPLIQ